MSYLNCFPQLPGWAWKLLGVLLVVGALTILGGIGWGAWWLISHLRWA